MSARQFSEMVGEHDVATIGRCFRQLRDWGYLELLEERPGSNRRGAMEKIYQATPRSTLNLSDWQNLPPKYKDRDSAVLIERLIHKIDEAIIARTMDFDTDRHLSWMSLTLDQQAWEECMVRLQEVATSIDGFKRESAKHSPDSQLIPATVALLAFRSPVHR